eukprot:159332-Chlamydomonas_euryale.AAC.3
MRRPNCMDGWMDGRMFGVVCTVICMQISEIKRAISGISAWVKRLSVGLPSTSGIWALYVRKCSLHAANNLALMLLGLCWGDKR